MIILLFLLFHLTSFFKETIWIENPGRSYIRSFTLHYPQKTLVLPDKSIPEQYFLLSLTAQLFELKFRHVKQLFTTIFSQKYAEHGHFNQMNVRIEASYFLTFQSWLIFCPSTNATVPYTFYIVNIISVLHMMHIYWSIWIFILLNFLLNYEMALVFKKIRPAFKYL